MSDNVIDSSAYVETHDLRWGHSDSVNALCFSPDARLLASGGNDRNLIIWDTVDGQLLFRRIFNSAVTSAVWHPAQADTVIVGCEDGEIAQIHRFSLSETQKYSVDVHVRSKVHCLSYTAPTRCLAIGLGSEVRITRERQPNTYQGNWKVPVPEQPDDQGDVLREKRAVSVQFTPSGRQVIVSYLARGVVCYELDDSYNQCWRILPPEESPTIGHAALSFDTKLILLHNINSGVDLYRIEDDKGILAGSYKFEQAPRSRKHLQVSFVQGSRGIVCGTTTGNVCVWYTGSKELFQKLHHDADIIPAISSADHSSYSYIATGSAEQGQSTCIKIWRARIGETRTTDSSTFEDTVAEFLEAVTSTPLRSRQAIRRVVAFSYTMLVFCAIALALAMGYTQLPWSSITSAMRSLLAFSVRCLALLRTLVDDITSSVHEEIDHAIQLLSDGTRTRVLAWLEKEASTMTADGTTSTSS